jgi:hypothetical protein
MSISQIGFDVFSKKEGVFFFSDDFLEGESEGAFDFCPSESEAA